VLVTRFGHPVAQISAPGVGRIRKRRISLPEQFHDWLEESVQALRLREAALTWRIAAELQTLAIGHDDPAERFLLATAKVFDLTLVTADERLIEALGLKVLANR